jgi:hypothetical protein
MTDGDGKGPVLGGHKRKFICSALREVVRYRCAFSESSTFTAQTRALTGAVFLKLGHSQFQTRPLRVKTGQYPALRKNVP